MASRLIHILGSNRWSGVERYALDLCRHFRNQGWKVAALTRDAKAVDNKFTDNSIPLFHAPLYGYFDWNTVISLVRFFHRKSLSIRRTIIHVHRYRDALPAIIARRLAGASDVKIVMTLHNVMKGKDNRIYRYIYRNLDAHLFVSHRVQDEFLSQWKGRSLPFRENGLKVVLNSLDFPYAEPLEIPSKGPIIAMYHGRLATGKGLEKLIEALSLISKRTLRLRIVGSGDPDYVDSLRHLAQTLGVMESIDWRKHVDDPIPLIEEAHFGILPSEEPEAFGLSNLEYMAAGRPVITTTNGGQTEYLTDGKDSFLIPPGDAQALADAMRTLSHDAELRSAMGKEACKTSHEKLSWSHFVAEMEQIYNSL